MIDFADTRAPRDPPGISVPGLMLLWLVCLGSVSAAAQPGHQAHHLTSEARAAARKEAAKPKVYYRPFCRRSHYVTDRSAPCWN